MNFFSYIGRVLHWLPVYDSEKLISAKNYRPSVPPSSDSCYDLHIKETDPFMFGAISPVSDDSDLLDSQEIEKKAAEIYKLCDK